MIHFGSIKAGVINPNGSKIELIRDTIPCLVVKTDLSVYFTWNVSVSGFHNIPKARSIGWFFYPCLNRNKYVIQVYQLLLKSKRCLHLTNENRRLSDGRICFSNGLDWFHVLANLNALLPKRFIFEPFLDEYLNKFKNWQVSK